ncbi:MAG: tetratricopeptide repeat protein [Candidatus Magasanikiibacteriota bacterium]
MYSITPFILIVLSLAVIIFIIVKKFPQLTLLDVNSIPEVKMEKKKDEIYKKRVAEKASELSEKRKVLFHPVVQRLKEIQLAFRKYVGEIERVLIRHKPEVVETPEQKKTKEQDLKDLIQDGEYSLNQKDLETAEKKFIAAIRIDPKSIDAYYGLGNVYFEQGQTEEAIETFQFILQMDGTDLRTLVKMGEIEEGKNNIGKAVEYYERTLLIDDNNPVRFAKIAELLMSVNKCDPAIEAISQAVELEPQNPKYLDRMVEISVLCGNRKMAEESYQKLRMVNPENQKLPLLKDKIDNMSV